MSAHDFREFAPQAARPIDGHEPRIVHNLTTGLARLTCNTCGWVGRGYKPRWHHLVEGTWRIHAGDIAMGGRMVHGTPRTARVGGCYCGPCDRVRGVR